MIKVNMVTSSGCLHCVLISGERWAPCVQGNWIWFRWVHVRTADYCAWCEA